MRARVPISTAIDWCHLPFLFSQFLRWKIYSCFGARLVGWWRFSVKLRPSTIALRQWKIDILQTVVSIHLLDNIQPLQQQQTTLDFDSINVLLCERIFCFKRLQCWFCRRAFPVLKVYDYWSNKVNCVTTFSVCLNIKLTRFLFCLPKKSHNDKTYLNLKWQLKIPSKFNFWCILVHVQSGQRSSLKDWPKIFFSWIFKCEEII